MHILEIPSFFPPSGGLFCLDQAKALAMLGHEVRILSNVQLGLTIHKKDYFTLPFGRYEHQMADITVYQSYQRGFPKVVRPNVKRWVRIVQSMFKDYEAKYGRPDILHAHCAKWAGYAAMKISQEYGIPYVITEHLSKAIFNDEFCFSGPQPFQIPMLTDAYCHAAMVIPVSKELVGSLAVYFGSDYQWKAIGNIVDVDFFHYQQREPLQGRPFRFCCLANYWPLKGYDILFAAFCRLRQQGLDVELHIAGRDTDCKECLSLLKEAVISHGLLDKLGVRELLFHSDALVLASRSETQGMALLEALSTGIPIVTTEAIPQSVRPQQGCSFVPIDDVTALVDAMRKVSQQQDFDGESVSKKIAEMASPQVIGKKLEQLFSEIVASK